jgi:DNA repair protein RadC
MVIGGRNKMKGKQRKMRTEKKKPQKRISIVSIKMVRESSVLYDIRKIGSPEDVVNLGRRFLEEEDREKLIVCCLDTKNQPTAINVVSVGSLNSSIVHPREVFKPAILSNSASIILFHNHPSGDTTPSNEDKLITERISQSGEMLGIKLLDHIIIGDNSYTSLKEEGIL